MTWHSTAITGAALFALVSQASAQNVAQLTKNGKNVSLNKSKCSRVYTSPLSPTFLKKYTFPPLFLGGPDFLVRFFTFLQLVINSNDVRFNRGGSHGEGDTDTVKGWINEMDEFETSFNEVRTVPYRNFIFNLATPHNLKASAQTIASNTVRSFSFVA